MPSIEQRLQRMEDIKAIEIVKHRYFRGIDTADIDLLRTLSTEDVTVDYEGGTYRWQVEGRDALLDQIANAFNASMVACHTGTHPEIEIMDADSATGLWYLTDIFMNLDERLITTGSALYRDNCAREGGHWRIRSTTYKRIYEQVERFETLPELTTHVLALTGRTLAA